LTEYFLREIWKVSVGLWSSVIDNNNDH